MILATHAIVGAAVGRFFPENPFLALITGFISHFLIDAIPHWQYPLKSIVKDKNNPKDLMREDMVVGEDFIGDLTLITIDLLSGLVLALYIFGTKGNLLNPSVLLGALGGILPDALTFAYFKFRVEPLATIQRLQIFANREGKNHIFENSHFKGFLSQTAFASLVIAVSKIIFR